MTPTIALLGTMDSKGREYAYVKQRAEQCDCRTLVIDVGAAGPPLLAPDVTRDEVRRAAACKSPTGSSSVEPLVDGAARLIERGIEAGQIHGVLALGGTRGTALAAAVMRRLPLGFPKLIVSTIAANDVTELIGSKDIVLVPAVADLLGLNQVTRRILSEAAGAVCGMARSSPVEAQSDRPLIAITNIGLTTVAALRAKDVLEQAGFETIVFHACGPGGAAMESLIAEGHIDGVLDLATLEVLQEMFDDLLLKRSTRMTAAGRGGIPQVVCPGGIDNIFGPRDKLVAAFPGRTFVHHSDVFSNTRATADELRALAREQARRLNAAQGPVEWFIPMRWFCAYSGPGGPFFDADADRAYVEELRRSLRPEIAVHVLDYEINDPEFAEQAARSLIRLLPLHRPTADQALAEPIAP